MSNRFSQRLVTACELIRKTKVTKDGKKLFSPIRALKAGLMDTKSMHDVLKGLIQLQILEKICVERNSELFKFISDSWPEVVWKGPPIVYRLLNEKGLEEIEKNPPIKTITEWEKFINSPQRPRQAAS